MKNISTFFAMVLLVLPTFGQKLVKVWETPAELKVPESVLYNPGSGKIFVANINGNPSDKDGNGFISIIKTDGAIETLRWVDGLNAPKGMAIRDGFLYVADLDQLVKIDIRQSTIVKRYPVAGAIFLNDVTIDDKGVVYVSDTQTGKLHFLKDDQVRELIPDPIKNINGLWADGTTLYVGSADITAIDLSSKVETVLISSTGGVDGLERLPDGNFVFSNWGGRIFITNGNTAIKLLDTTAEKMNTADIDFARELNLVLVPTFFSNKVVAYRLEK